VAVSLLLYDVTTLYFEAESEEALRKAGDSKERRIDPQIVVGLLVDRTGFPLEIVCFEGTAETTTIVPIIAAFTNRHDLGDTPMVVAACRHAVGIEPQVWFPRIVEVPSMRRPGRWPRVEEGWLSLAEQRSPGYLLCANTAI
jgi:hypothetical protein